MRVLLRSADRTELHCIKVYAAGYVPEDGELILENEDCQIVVSGISQYNAEAAIRALYTDGKADLSAYPTDL